MPDSSEALANIRGYRATFNEAAQRSIAAGVTPSAHAKALITNVMAAFDAIEAEFEHVKSGEERDRLVERAEELERLRAYVIPAQDVPIDGRAAMADMAEWAVPAGVMQKLSEEVAPLVKATDERVARAALRSLYETYDYWDWYVEDHSRTMHTYARVLLVLLVLALFGAVCLLHVGHVYSGIACAGISGALLSVLAKLPPVMGYGAANAYKSRIMSRVGTGFAASLIGMGLLASNILAIQLPGDVTVAEMLNGKDIREDNEAVVKNQEAPIDAGVAIDAVEVPVDAGPDAEMVQVGMDQEVDAGAAPVHVAATETKPASVTAPPPLKRHRFSTRAVLILVALAMLFGFSERALSTFEDKIFPTPRVTVSATTESAGSPNPGPPAAPSLDDPPPPSDASAQVPPAPLPSLTGS